MFADELRLAESLDRDRRDEGAALRVDPHQPLLRQLDERLAHWRATDAEAVAQVEFRHRRAGREDAADDIIAQMVEHLTGQPPVAVQADGGHGAGAPRLGLVHPVARREATVVLHLQRPSCQHHRTSVCPWEMGRRRPPGLDRRRMGAGPDRCNGLNAIPHIFRLCGMSHLAQPHKLGYYTNRQGGATWPLQFLLPFPVNGCRWRR